MARPWKAMTVVSVLLAYLLTTRRGQWSTSSFIAGFFGTWMAQFAIWMVWAVQLYPKLFSTLRHLPEPAGNSFFHGQYHRIAAEPTGFPMIDWINNIPNDGLIRYKGIFNQERLLITSPKALAEVLVTKNYDFVKPSQVRNAVVRILGRGLLHAEGDEHKAQRRSLLPAFAFRRIKDMYPVFWAKSKESILAITEQVLLDESKEPVSLGQEPSSADASASSPSSSSPSRPVMIAPYKRETSKADIKCQQQEQQQQPHPDPVPAKTAVLEVGGWASRATLDIIGIAGMGHDFGAIRNPHSELIQTYTKVFQPSRQSQILGLLGVFIPLWILRRLPIKRNDEIHQAASVIRATCRDLIRAKKEKLLAARSEKQRRVGEKGGEESGPTPAGGGWGANVDILSIALESGGFTDENLVDQLMTFLAAGHETTATAMTWAIYMLCLNPDVQSRLRAEIRACLPSPGSDNSILSSLDIDRMPYLNAVCSEVLRYFGPVPMTYRETVRDTTIVGQFVPKGTRIIISPWAVNKSRAMWGPDAEVFNPERWLVDDDAGAEVKRGPNEMETTDASSIHSRSSGRDENNQKTKKPATAGGPAASGGATSNYAFMTFLHGPRSCIGTSFARGEFACLLAAWVGRFEFSLHNEEELDEKNVLIKGGVTARPANGMFVRTRVLDGW